ncbi:MAG: imidazoleglycerol-phosphate dehydratase HisB, partial [Clostridia bacterium]|nr:imidazoleglycerol-phosphate dehydratase HisB [Clostridia bacterium]
GEVRRETRETAIAVSWELDGTGSGRSATGLPFFDHLLSAFARHGHFDLEVEARGDLEVEGHHVVEDTGIVLGQALRQAVGDGAGIRRFGWSCVPMDEACTLVAVDLSGRPYLHWKVPTAPRHFGAFHTELAPEFWRALSAHAGLTLHVRLLSGANAHHVLECVWKAVGLALAAAVARQGPADAVPSTKGVLL